MSVILQPANNLILTDHGFIHVWELKSDYYIITDIGNCKVESIEKIHYENYEINVKDNAKFLVQKDDIINCKSNGLKEFKSGETVIQTPQDLFLLKNFQIQRLKLIKTKRNYNKQKFTLYKRSNV